ncbi:Rox3 mediator complex subunit-domain-containing protein [Phyllosticta capitalensis]|uniref:Mediator of RNA polymerase II transcription subunit 19 n=1 Tax=Phyllosticta capitalensis TaxID=121624 RepID=A0ABR1YVZ1_9PEZI
MSESSFSPASPPYHLAKSEQPSSTTLNQQPNTPTSPPYMSSFGQSQSYDSTASTSAKGQGLTPPSSANMSQSSQQPTATSFNVFPTPSSTAGVSFASKHDDGESRQPGDKMEGVESDTQRHLVSGGDSDHRHTGHDRTGTGSSTSDGVGSGQLTTGTGFFKLSETPYTKSRPHVSQNLVSLYRLDDITKSVARFDLQSGEKLHKLRKSYEGYVKEFKLSGGKSKPEARQDQLLSLVQMPDEEWYAQRVHGKELERGVNPLMDKLNKALKMTPGKLPPSEETKWKSRIGADEPSLKRPGGELLDNAAKKARIGQGSLQGRSSATSSPALRPSGAAKPGVVRPDRAGKKRSYVESSFRGYGEGFADDDLADSTGGEDDGRGNANKKKRRKDFTAGSPLGFNERRGSSNVGYQAGMVGVRQ